MRGFGANLYNGHWWLGSRVRGQIKKEKIYRFRYKDQECLTYYYSSPGSVESHSSAYGKFSNGTYGYQKIPPADKQAWKAKAKKRIGITGMNLYIRQWMWQETHHLDIWYKWKWSGMKW